MAVAPFSFFIKRRKMDSMRISKRMTLLVYAPAHRTAGFWGRDDQAEHQRWIGNPIRSQLPAEIMRLTY
jgi:hypothetical protein